jgi:uncharacterized protein (TIGR02118 family)
MLYYIVDLTRRADVSQDEFERRWLDEHLSLARRLPGVVSAAFYPVAEPADSDGVRPAGVGILAFRSRDDIEVALRSEEAAALRRHTATFADADSARRLIARDPVGFVLGEQPTLP